MPRLFSIATVAAITLSAMTAVTMTAPGVAQEATPAPAPAPVVLPTTPVEPTPIFRSEPVVQPRAAAPADAVERIVERADAAAERGRLRRASSLSPAVSACVSAPWASQSWPSWTPHLMRVLPLSRQRIIGDAG